MSSSFPETKVIIRSNEFIERDISAFIVTIDTNNKSLLLELDKPIKSKGRMYRHVVALPRIPQDNLYTLNVSGILGCSVTWVPDDKYDPNNPMDLSWWRGGAAAITDLCIV